MGRGLGVWNPRCIFIDKSEKSAWFTTGMNCPENIIFNAGYIARDCLPLTMLIRMLDVVQQFHPRHGNKFLSRTEPLAVEESRPKLG